MFYLFFTCREKIIKSYKNREALEALPMFSNLSVFKPQLFQLIQSSSKGYLELNLFKSKYLGISCQQNTKQKKHQIAKQQQAKQENWTLTRQQNNKTVTEQQRRDSQFFLAFYRYFSSRHLWLSLIKYISTTP